MSNRQSMSLWWWPLLPFVYSKLKCILSHECQELFNYINHWIGCFLHGNLEARMSKRAFHRITVDALHPLSSGLVLVPVGPWALHPGETGKSSECPVTYSLRLRASSGSIQEAFWLQGFEMSSWQEILTVIFVLSCWTQWILFSYYYLIYRQENHLDLETSW